MTKKKEREILEQIKNGGKPYLNMNLPIIARIPVNIAEVMINNTMKNVNDLIEKAGKPGTWYAKLDHKYIGLELEDINKLKQLLWFKRRIGSFLEILDEAKRKKSKYVYIKENIEEVENITNNLKKLNYVDSKIFYGTTVE